MIDSTQACRDLMAYITTPGAAAAVTVQPLIREARRFPLHVDQPMLHDLEAA